MYTATLQGRLGLLEGERATSCQRQGSRASIHAFGARGRSRQQGHPLHQTVDVVSLEFDDARKLVRAVTEVAIRARFDLETKQVLAPTAHGAGDTGDSENVGLLVPVLVPN